MSADPVAKVPPKGSSRRDRSRRELLQTAIDCFSRHGYQGTSIDRIARMAGVTKGAIYYHFRDKADLLAAAVDDRVGAFEQRVQSACEGAGPSEALDAIAKVCIQHARSADHPRFAIKLMVESIDTNDQVIVQMRGMMRRFRAFLRNLIRDGQQSGAFRADADAEAVAASYAASVIGTEVQFYLDPERVALDGTLEAYLNQLSADLVARPGTETATPGEGSND